MKIFKIAPIFLLFFLLSSTTVYSTAFAQGMTTSDEQLEDEFEEDWYLEDDELMAIHDPHENLNRKVLKFNNWLAENIFNPLSYVYDAFIPKKVQSSINNASKNLGAPKRFFNNIFQKKFKRSGVELSRFVINSTIGIAGLFDPAYAAFDLEAYNEDFGQTLGYYGMEPGTFLMLPIFGPSNTRDVIGFFGDMVLSPTFWTSQLETFSENDIVDTVNVVRRANNYSYNVRDAAEKIKKDAIDPYISLQDFYMQHRDQKIKN